MQNIEESKIDL
jgi:hypothetical protein